MHPTQESSEILMQIIPEQFRPQNDPDSIGVFLILQGVYWGLKPFSGAKDLSRHILGLMHRFCTEGIQLGEVQAILSDNLVSYIWAITAQAASTSNFSRGPSGSVHSAFVQKMRWYSTKGLKFLDQDPAVNVRYTCPKLVSKFRLNPKDRTAQENETEFQSDSLSDYEESFVVKIWNTKNE
jgi:hypothetical protein